MEIRRATDADLPAMERLLTSAALPLDGAASAFATGVVACDGDRLIGGAAIEPFGGTALLRSVAVEADQRGRGVGQAVVTAAESLARDGGAETLILLTDSAAPWFERLGYEPIERGSVGGPVASSIEFTTACSTSAVAMRRRLG